MNGDQETISRYKLNILRTLFFMLSCMHLIISILFNVKHVDNDNAKEKSSDEVTVKDIQRIGYGEGEYSWRDGPNGGADQGHRTADDGDGDGTRGAS